MRAFTLLFALVGTALAQRISIGAPVKDQALTVGQNTSVSVLNPATLSSSTEMGIAVLLHHCAQTPCEDASQTMGLVLYAGGYNPQRGTGFHGQPVQNFSVAIPEGFEQGPAVLSVAHASLIGAGPSLFSEIANVTVNIG